MGAGELTAGEGHARARGENVVVGDCAIVVFGRLMQERDFRQIELGRNLLLLLLREGVAIGRRHSNNSKRIAAEGRRGEDVQSSERQLHGCVSILLSKLFA